MTHEELCEVDVEKISISPFQPRRTFNSTELEELAASIISVGLIHPPLVRRVEDRFELISGERRFRAAQLAGLKKIPVVIRPQNDHTSAQAALIENIQRVDLNPIEIAKALRGLASQCKLNQEELAKKIGKKRSTIANYLRLLTLPIAIQESISNTEISMGHAKAILSLENPTSQHTLHQRIVREGLTVRQAEEIAYQNQKKKEPPPYTPPPQQDCHLAALAAQIQNKLGTKVTIQGRANCEGTVCIEYYSLEDLDRFLNLLEISE